MSELAKCRTCGELVSTNATTCPHCGEPYPTRSIVCPNCGSDELVVHGRKGFSTGTALVGALLVGPLGAAVGAFGHQNIRLTCSKCGHSWEASPQELQAQVKGVAPLKKGATVDGVVLSVHSGVITVDLGDERRGTVLGLNAIQRQRREKGYPTIKQGDSIRVTVVWAPGRGILGAQLGYNLEFVDLL